MLYLSGGEKLGTCCEAHLTTKIRDYAKNAQNGAVTITIIENPRANIEYKDDKIWIRSGCCDYCNAPAEYTVSYYPKK